VAENDGFCRGALGSADNAVMRQFIDEKRIVRSKDMRNRRHIGEIAADQGQSVLDSEEFGEAGLQTAMRGALASDEAGTKRTDPKLLQRTPPPL